MDLGGTNMQDEQEEKEEWIELRGCFWEAAKISDRKIR